jgi:hypothetical protein
MSYLALQKITPHEKCPSLTGGTLATARFSDKHKGKCAALIAMTPKVLSSRCLDLPPGPPLISAISHNRQGHEVLLANGI